MPTRLADGLGPESDRADGSPSAYAPSPDILRGFGSPARTGRKAGSLRLLTRHVAEGGAESQLEVSQVTEQQLNKITMSVEAGCWQAGRESSNSHIECLLQNALEILSGLADGKIQGQAEVIHVIEIRVVLNGRFRGIGRFARNINGGSVALNLYPGTTGR